ncbi:MAG: hypothetical protein WCD33_21995, partial [Mycobacterium sp.]|uniref:hypothetical protein n=1 Tax=Mycobacterium sp. TaxID=1785 RepID=UPI003C724640
PHASSIKGGDQTAPRVHRRPIQDHRPQKGAPINEGAPVSICYRVLIWSRADGWRNFFRNND